MKRQFSKHTSNSDKVFTTRNKRLKRIPRLITALIILLLTVVMLFIVTAEDFNPFKNVISSIAPTPTLAPTPIPTPAPTPTPISTPTPAPTPPPSGKKIMDAIVVVDPGHGGYDPGTTSPFEEGFYEKEVTLDIGMRLKEKLENAGVQVVMTRETDIALDPYWKADVWARPEIANKVGATFFVSIHVNGFDGKNAEVYNGTEIYHQGKKHGEYSSKDFATMMGEEIDAVTDTKYNGVIKEDFGVTRLSEMPAVLVETAYITNPEDHQRLKSDDFREDMTQGILNGTLRILETLGAYKENGVYKILVDVDS